MTARIMNKSDFLKISSSKLQINHYCLLVSCTKDPMAPSRQPRTATVPTARTPAVTPKAKISRLIMPKRPKANTALPIKIKTMPDAIKNRQMLVNKVMLTVWWMLSQERI